ncbi:immunoglobulin-like domain protein [Finch poxvirus]|uniref:Immunoglobulin-like domain protein n=2 Tax=unclassified Avipoxvirus TaxID=336487 RepID=A0AAT9UQE0_9POXV|nr:immunoglobulin-like domain protein [Finch poxvirus]UOX39139.1 immunoglobulin-like domain protein [Finch poxvirus]
MIYIIPFTYKIGISRKELILILVLHLIDISITFLVVEVPSVPYLLIPENGDAQLTCMFKDNIQPESEDKVNVYWVLLKHDQSITHGITHNWDSTKRVGKTNLHMSNVTKEKEGKYRCIVWVSDSFDYKYVELETTDGIDGGKGGIEVIPQHSNMWNWPPLEINCTFRFKEWCGDSVNVNWWKLNTTTYIWDQQVTGVSWWSNEWGGNGWLNITNPTIEEIETIYMCTVTCGYSGGFGTREPVTMSYQSLGITVEYDEYPKWTL